MTDDKKLTRVNVRLLESDLEFIKKRFPDNYNAQIRRIIRFWVAAQPKGNQDVRT